MEDNIQVDEDDPNYSEYFTVREEALFACNECGHLTVQLRIKVDLFTENISRKYTQNVRHVSTGQLRSSPEINFNVS